MNGKIYVVPGGTQTPQVNRQPLCANLLLHCPLLFALWHLLADFVSTHSSSKIQNMNQIRTVRVLQDFHLKNLFSIIFRIPALTKKQLVQTIKKRRTLLMFPLSMVILGNNLAISNVYSVYIRCLH